MDTTTLAEIKTNLNNLHAHLVDKFEKQKNNTQGFNHNVGECTNFLNAIEKIVCIHQQLDTLK